MHSRIEVRFSTHLKGSVIICQNLCRRTLLIEEHLQLVDYTCRILLRKMSPDGKSSGAAVDHRKKMGPVTMGDVHRYPVPCLFNIQSLLWPVYGCWIDRLTLFTFSDDGFHCGFRDLQSNLSHKIKCPLHTRMTALSMNNLDLVKPKWAHGCSAGRLHRPSVSFNCIKPPLRHSSQSICLILPRFDQGHIHRQRVFFHQFYYRVKPP